MAILVPVKVLGACLAAVGHPQILRLRPEQSSRGMVGTGAVVGAQDSGLPGVHPPLPVRSYGVTSGHPLRSCISVHLLMSSTQPTYDIRAIHPFQK